MNNKQILIFLDREFGSGGHNIAKGMAKKLGIPYYDYNILEDMFHDNPEMAALMAKYDDKPAGMFVTRHVRGYTNSIEENLMLMQFDYIRGKADAGESFVVVGRCAELILRDFPNLISVFVRADMEDRTARVMEREKKTQAEAVKKIKRIDDMHRKGFNRLSDNKWGFSESYDLCINSTGQDLDELVEAFMPYIEMRIKNYK